MLSGPDIVRVAASDAMLNGAAVSPEGRVFSSFPRWTETLTPGVAEAMPDGTFKPFPGGAWNDWRPGASTQDRFVAVHSVHADRDNNLWVIDDSAPHHQTLEGARPKIVKIDLKRNVMASMCWTHQWLRDAQTPNREFLFLLEKE